MKTKIPAVFIILIILGTMANAQIYYANVVFEVTSNGNVITSGNSNHPALTPHTSPDFTSKIGNTWEFEVNLQGEFSAYIYEVRLPAGSEIIDVNTNAQYRISNENGTLAIIGSDENSPLFIKTKYTVHEANTGINNLIPLALLIISAIAIVILILILRRHKNKNTGEVKIQNSLPLPLQNRVLYNKEALTERQLAIVEYLEKHGNVTQAELQRALALPKAALSRNLLGLEKKGIISKERKGMSMLVMLKKE